jgi:hypothetical protein
LDRPDRERADEGARQPPQAAADADDVGRRLALVEDQLHDGEAVGQHRGRDAGLDDPARHEVARRRGVQEDGLPRRHQRDRLLREPPLGVGRDLEAAGEGILVRRGRGKDATTMGAPQHAAAGELIKVPPRRHR